MTPLSALSTRNLGLKILAVLLACLLWLQVASQETVRMTLTAPVEFLDMPAGLEISNDYPKEVEVVLQTDRPRTIENRRLSATIDMRGATPGTAIIHLTSSHLPGARGAEIVSITPARLRLQIEETRTKAVDVKVTIVGSPAPGYQIVEARTIPLRVPLSGPQSRIEQVTEASTEPISVEGLTASLKVEVALDLEDPRLRFGNTDRVTAIITIEEKRKNVEVKGVSVKVLPEEVSAQLIDRRVNLEGTVPKSYNDKLDPSLFSATVDVEKVEAGNTIHQLPPNVQIPDVYKTVFRLGKVSPEKVRLRRRN